jgi:hypothetical protein
MATKAMAEPIVLDDDGILNSQGLLTFSIPSE